MGFSGSVCAAAAAVVVVVLGTSAILESLVVEFETGVVGTGFCCCCCCCGTVEDELIVDGSTLGPGDP